MHKGEENAKNTHMQDGVLLVFWPLDKLPLVARRVLWISSSSAETQQHWTTALWTKHCVL